MLKVGVVGVGHLGRFHAEKYAKLPDVELVGVADADPDRAAAVAAPLGSGRVSGLPGASGAHRGGFGPRCPRPDTAMSPAPCWMVGSTCCWKNP